MAPPCMADTPSLGRNAGLYWVPREGRRLGDQVGRATADPVRYTGLLMEVMEAFPEAAETMDPFCIIPPAPPWLWSLRET